MLYVVHFPSGTASSLVPAVATSSVMTPSPTPGMVSCFLKRQIVEF